MRRGWWYGIARLLVRARQAWLWLARPLTVGVRVILCQPGPNGARVLLVRQTYQDGWLLPGGGVQRGETPEAAARREAREETGAALGDLRLLGVFTNFHQYKSDHVLVFACTDFEVAGPPTDRLEIAERRFFPVDCLPEDVLAGHRRRIEEFLRGGAAPGFGLW